MLSDRRILLPIVGHFFQGEPDERWRRALQVIRDDDALRVGIGDWAPRLVEQAIMGKHDRAGNSAHGRLALIITLDTMPRIMYRGQARSLAGDMAAQGQLLEGIAAHQDDQLSTLEKLYFYRPFIHAEDVAMQAQGLRVYKGISLDTEDFEHEVAEAFYHAAVEHHAIVQRFGRFPERNRLLGRRSKPAEVVYLEAIQQPWYGIRGSQNLMPAEPALS